MLILMTPWETRACVVTHTANPFALQAISQLPAKFLGVLVCSSRRFACRESCYVNRQVFQEYEETCLFTKHESLQGDSPRVYPNILKCSLHSLVTKGIRLVGFATRAMVRESSTHYLILNSLAFAGGRVILRSHFLILLLLIILISHYILPYFSLLQ